VLLPVRKLSPSQLEAVAALEQRVVAADGGRLKLEHATLRGRTGEDVEDLLWEQDGRLLGFLGRYAFGGAVVELAGMVDPSARRRGIGTALLDAAVGLGRERGETRALLVATPAGRPFAEARGLHVEHSEHALVLDGEPSEGPDDPALALRAAVPEDGAEVRRLLQAAFGWTPPGDDDLVPTARDRTLVVERDGRVVATLRLSLDDGRGGVYGFAVDPALQGRGIGRDVLRRACRDLRARGASTVGLEVAVENERALGLYTSVGFRRVSTEDYWAVQVPLDGREVSPVV
jgi:ribosomal protein S18 acetylase RimI-like enzyme